MRGDPVGCGTLTPQQFDASILSDEASAPGLPNFTGAFVGVTAQDMAGTAMPADVEWFDHRERPYAVYLDRAAGSQPRSVRRSRCGHAVVTLWSRRQPYQARTIKHGDTLPFARDQASIFQLAHGAIDMDARQAQHIAHFVLRQTRGETVGPWTSLTTFLCRQRVGDQLCRAVSVIGSASSRGDASRMPGSVLVWRSIMRCTTGLEGPLCNARMSSVFCASSNVRR